MQERIVIRPEAPADHQRVEELTRAAFYNLYIPGATEHYLVRTLRTHPDFIPELDLVLELDGRVVGNIMYTKNRLADEAGRELSVLTFGPVCIDPALQRRGYGKQLMERSFQLAAGLGYGAVVIFGAPANYVARGFKSCLKCGVSLPDGSFPAAMLVKELEEGVLAGHRWTYHQSSAYEFSETEALAYDDALPPLEKKVLPCQEEFFILSHATLR